MKKLLTALFLTMFSSSAYAQQTTINLCTGTDKGSYYPAGKQIAKMAGNNLVNVIQTEGTLDNINKMIDGTCDAMIGQPDGLAYLKRTSPSSASGFKTIGTLHREYLIAMCNKDSDVENIADLTSMKNVSIAVGDNGSGTWLIWDNFKAEDKSYEKVPVTNDGGIIALSGVASGEPTCMLISSGLKNGTVAEANTTYKGQVVLVEASDKDFNDAKDFEGKPLYTFKDIPSGTYKEGLQKGHWSGSETVSWNAKVYIYTERFTDKKKLADFIQAVGRAAVGIRAEYGE